MPTRPSLVSVPTAPETWPTSLLPSSSQTVARPRYALVHLACEPATTTCAHQRTVTHSLPLTHTHTHSLIDTLTLIPRLIPLFLPRVALQQAFDIEQLRALLGTDAGMLNSFDFGSIRLTRGNDHLPTPDNGGANSSGALPPPPMAGLDAGSGFGAFGGPNDFTTSNPIFTPEVAAAPLPIPTGTSDDGGGVYVPDVVPDDDMDNAVELPDIVPSSSSSSSTTSAPPA